jgi:hypothetical protein
MEIHIIQVGQKGLPSFVPEKQKGGQHYLDNIRLKKIWDAQKYVLRELKSGRSPNQPCNSVGLGDGVILCIQNNSPATFLSFDMSYVGSRVEGSYLLFTTLT